VKGGHSSRSDVACFIHIIIIIFIVMNIIAVNETVHYGTRFRKKMGACGGDRDRAVSC
jgi:hypothetical protein